MPTLADLGEGRPQGRHGFQFPVPPLLGGRGPLPARLLSWKLTSHAQNHFPTKGPSLGSYYLLPRQLPEAL